MTSTKKILNHEKNPSQIGIYVYRSTKHIQGQLVDLESGQTLATVTDYQTDKGTKLTRAHAVGKIIAEQVQKFKASKVVFLRRGLRYHGRVQALADGAREGGLKF